nr:trigger factor [uncultured Mediterraneibacter sp.]
MKKKLLTGFLIAAMTLSLAGCGSKLSNDYVTVNKYKGLEVTEVATTDVTDDMVEAQINSTLEAAATEEEVTDRAAKNGDWVNIDYTGSIDGTEFDGGAATGYDLELGSGTFLAATDDYKGFEEQIEGHKKGEEFDIQVQFPETYSNNTDLAGKAADFHIVLNKIYTKTTPELTDDWVSENSETSKTVDEYKAEVKKQLEDQYNSNTNSQLKSEVQTALLDQVEVKSYPDGAVDDQVQQANDYYTQIAQMYGVELSDFITTYLNTTEDDFNEKIEESAKQAVQLQQALELIAEKEKLTPSDKEYEEGIKEYAEKAGTDDVDSYMESVGEDVLKDAILRDKVLDYLVEKCVQVEQSDTSSSGSSTTSSSSK